MMILRWIQGLYVAMTVLWYCPGANIGPTPPLGFSNYRVLSGYSDASRRWRYPRLKERNPLDNVNVIEAGSYSKPFGCSGMHA
jgi:hypothetical protein